MAEQHTYICDLCGKDCGNGNGPLLVTIASLLEPSQRRDYHFCDIGCLQKWPPDLHARYEALDSLVAQAQELNMGY